MGQNTFRAVVKPRQKIVTTDFAGVLDFSGRTTSFKITSGQSLPFVSTSNTEHLIEGQTIEIYNASSSDILIDGSLMHSGTPIDIEAQTVSVLIWTSTNKFLDLGGSAYTRDVEDRVDEHIDNYDLHHHNGSDSKRIEGADLAHTNAAENDMLRIIGGKPTWNNPFNGPQADRIQVTNLNTSTNINTSTWTTIPIGGSTIISPKTSYLSRSGNSIIVGMTGIIKAKINTYYTSTTNGVNVGVSFAKNGTKLSGIGAQGFIQGWGAPIYSTSSFERTIRVNAGDVITAISKQVGATGNARMIAGESLLEIEIPAESISEGPQGERGYSGWDFLYGSIIPETALGEDGDTYLHTPTADLYKKESGNWNYITNLKGAPGSSGQAISLIYAEESAGLADNSQEWSFGDGARSYWTAQGGIVVHKDGQATAMTLSVENTGSSTTTVELIVNGNSVGKSISLTSGTGKGVQTFSTPYSFQAGDSITFRTVLGGGARNAKICLAVEFNGE